jgi:hypothetical protein
MAKQNRDSVGANHTAVAVGCREMAAPYYCFIIVIIIVIIIITELFNEPQLKYINTTAQRGNRVTIWMQAHGLYSSPSSRGM